MHHHTPKLLCFAQKSTETSAETYCTFHNQITYEYAAVKSLIIPVIKCIYRAPLSRGGEGGAARMLVPSMHKKGE